MIEDKDLGIKIAEDLEENVWADVEKNAQKEIEAMKKAIIFQEGLLELVKIKLKK